MISWSRSRSCLMYVALAVSWAMFSGATRYLSLGTSAFFGLGAYVTGVGRGEPAVAAALSWAARRRRGIRGPGR